MSENEYTTIRVFKSSVTKLEDAESWFTANRCEIIEALAETLLKVLGETLKVLDMPFEEKIHQKFDLVVSKDKMGFRLLAIPRATAHSRQVPMNEPDEKTKADTLAEVESKKEGKKVKKDV